MMCPFCRSTNTQKYSGIDGNGSYNYKNMLICFCKDCGENFTQDTNLQAKQIINKKEPKKGKKIQGRSYINQKGQTVYY